MQDEKMKIDFYLEMIKDRFQDDLSLPQNIYHGYAELEYRQLSKIVQFCICSPLSTVLVNK